MKKIHSYIYLLVLLGYGCSDFLKETSLNLVYPSNLDDLNQLFIGEAYRRQAIDYMYNRYYLLVDNFEINPKKSHSSFSKLEQNIYLWNPSMFSDELTDGFNDVDLHWSLTYKRILGSNLVLDHIDVLDGNDKERETLRGEALALRAWCYLHLVNAYGVAYNQGNPDTEPGVPLKLESGVRDEYFTRASVQKVYDQIEKDLLEGNRLLRLYPAEKNNPGRINHLAAKAMLSRMYLYQEKWDQAIAWADSVLEIRNELLDFNTLKTATFPVDSIYTNESIWLRKYSYPTDTYFMVSDGLLQTYGIGDRTQIDKNPDSISDLRCLIMLTGGAYASQFMRCSDGAYEGIRTVELYLNLAEAYAQKFIQEKNTSYKEKVLKSLNIIRQHRYRKEDFHAIGSDSDGKALLEECINERWRELGGEINHRWCDVRRYGKTLKHEFNDLVVEQDMSRFTLPIPDKVLDKNPNL